MSEMILATLFNIRILKDMGNRKLLPITAALSAISITIRNAASLVCPKIFSRKVRPQLNHCLFKTGYLEW